MVDHSDSGCRLVAPAKDAPAKLGEIIAFQRRRGLVARRRATHAARSRSTKSSAASRSSRGASSACCCAPGSRRWTRRTPRSTGRFSACTFRRTRTTGRPSQRSLIGPDDRLLPGGMVELDTGNARYLIRFTQTIERQAGWSWAHVQRGAQALRLKRLPTGEMRLKSPLATSPAVARRLARQSAASSAHHPASRRQQSCGVPIGRFSSVEEIHGTSFISEKSRGGSRCRRRRRAGDRRRAPSPRSNGGWHRAFRSASIRSSAAPIRSRSAVPQQPTASSRSRLSPAAKSCPPFGVVDAVQNATVECCSHRAVLLLRQGSDVRVRCGDPVRPEYAPAERLDVSRRRPGADARVLQGLQHDQLPGRQHRRADGRLVPQGDQDGRRSEGPEDAHRGYRRAAAGQAGRGAAADSRRRHLSGAGKRHDRCRRMGRPLRRREARLLQGRQVLLLSWLVGRQYRSRSATSTSRPGKRCRRTTRRSSRPPATRRIWT